jgi:Ni/Co efflux regulator RcnB
MASHDPPTPPAGLSTEIVTTLNESSTEQLEDVARYAEKLAEHKAREARREADADEDETRESPEDLPDEVPSKATITIKEINDNRYYYWQWREGDKVKSKYKGPANPDDE